MLSTADREILCSGGGIVALIQFHVSFSLRKLRTKEAKLSAQHQPADVF
jgi:hypothetical protein